MNDIEYSFNIVSFDVHKELYGKKNVVFCIRAFLEGTHRVDDNTCISAKEYFITNIPTNNLTNFIEYEKITKDIADKWIAEYQGHNIGILHMRVRSKLFPTTLSLAPPF